MQREGNSAGQNSSTKAKTEMELQSLRPGTIKFVRVLNAAVLVPDGGVFLHCGVSVGGGLFVCAAVVRAVPQSRGGVETGVGCRRGQVLDVLVQGDGSKVRAQLSRLFQPVLPETHLGSRFGGGGGLGAAWSAALSGAERAPPSWPSGVGKRFWRS